jgi:threonine dehydrogenase-like Zn-dependent dehydrogenase
VKKGGQVILAGLYPEQVPFGLNAIVTNELEIKGTWTSGVFTDWERTIALVEAGQVRLSPLISHRFPLENWREVVQLMEQGACIKSVFLFD